MGGVLTAVYGDAMPEGYKLNVILRDVDNIEAGDADPIETGEAPSSDDAQEAYY